MFNRGREIVYKALLLEDLQAFNQHLIKVHYTWHWYYFPIYIYLFADRENIRFRDMLSDVTKVINRVNSIAAISTQEFLFSSLVFNTLVHTFLINMMED